MVGAKIAKDATSARESVFDLPLDELASRVDAVHAQVGEALATLAGLTRLDATSRLHGANKLKQGEEQALLALARVIEAHPDLFASVKAKRRNGTMQPIEARTLREGLERIALLAALVAELKEQVTLVADTILTLGAEVKATSSAAYPVAKALARVNDTLRGLLAPTTDYYSSLARKANRTKAAKRGLQTE